MTEKKHGGKRPRSGRKVGPEGPHKPRTVRIDDNRWNALTTRSKRAGMSISAYVIKMIDGQDNEKEPNK